jgi:hypothetical protein
MFFNRNLQGLGSYETILIDIENVAFKVCLPTIMNNSSHAISSNFRLRGADDGMTWRVYGEGKNRTGGIGPGKSGFRVFPVCVAKSTQAPQALTYSQSANSINTTQAT